MFFKVIYKSILDNFGRESHTRIASYFILISIIITNLIYNFIDLKNAFVLWGSTNLNKIYVVPSEHVLIFTLILSHHLVLLGIKKSSEIKEMNAKANDTKLDTNTTTNDILNQTNSDGATSGENVIDDVINDIVEEPKSK